MGLGAGISSGDASGLPSQHKPFSLYPTTRFLEIDLRTHNSPGTMCGTVSRKGSVNSPVQTWTGGRVEIPGKAGKKFSSFHTHMQDAKGAQMGGRGADLTVSFPNQRSTKVDLIRGMCSECKSSPRRGKESDKAHPPRSSILQTRVRRQTRSPSSPRHPAYR